MPLTRMDCADAAVALASHSALLIPRGHQDGVIDRRAKLNGRNQNRSDKRKRRAREIRDAQVERNRKLDHGNQQNRQRERLEHQRDDDENRGDGNDADNLKVTVGAAD